MRIGSFYGFTVPMLLLIYDENMKQIVSSFDTQLNSTAAYDLKKELWHFRKAVAGIKNEVCLNQSILPQYVNSVSVRDGAIIGKIVQDNQQLADEIFNSLCDICASKLYEKIVDDKVFYDLSSLVNEDTFFKNLRQLVTKAMSTKSFSLDNTGILVRSFLKELKTEKESSIADIAQVTQNIKTFCGVTEKIPDVVFLNGNPIEFTEDEKTVLQYFKGALAKLDEIQRCISIEDYSEENIFGIPFVDFLNRKPTCLYYMVVGHFNHLRNSDIRLLPSVLSTVTEEFNHCKRLLDERLFAETEVGTFVHRSDIEEVFYDSAPDMQSFYEDVFNLLGISAIAKNDLIKLGVLYDNARYLKLSGINEILKTNFTRSSFEKAVNKFNMLGIGGLNVYSEVLFMESLSEIIFTGRTAINKSDEYMAEIRQICADIDALLSTFKPIGGALNV